MLAHSADHSNRQTGFTLVELMISMTLVAIIGTTFLVFFKSSFINYLNLQGDASSLTQLDTQVMRVATVVRSLTDITSAGDDDLQIYAYFYPSDAYVSVVHYYLQTTSGTTKLLADVTPMTANPPIGTPLAGQKKTYTIIDNYYQPAGGKLFVYLDSAGSSLATPISDLKTIKGVQVNLASKISNGGNQAVDVQVNLRNRKTNL